MIENILTDLRDLLSVDSTTGFSGPLDQLLLDKCRALGFSPWRLNKGGVRVDLGGEGRPLFITAHGDDIGLMVRRILPDGTLEVYNVGGNPPFQTIHENVRVHTRRGRVLTEFVAASRKGSYLSSYARDYIELVRQLHRFDSAAKPKP